jgi:putative heme iron utilization protein
VQKRQFFTDRDGYHTAAQIRGIRTGNFQETSMAPQSLPRQLIADCTVGSLGTLEENGYPLVTLVTVASLSPTSLVLLLSGLARHTRNLKRVPKCSLLLVERGTEKGDPMAGARMTVTGDATKIPRDHAQKARERFLQVHPSAAYYADFADFDFFLLEAQEAHLVAGFGRIETIPASQL